MIDYDIVVVGAGPAGSITAALLGARGYRVLLADRARFPRPKACAEYCSPGVEAVLSRAGAWQAVAPKVRRLPGMNLFIDGQPVLPIRYGRGLASALAFSIPRTELDAELLQHAGRRKVEIAEATRVEGVAIEIDSVHIRARSRAGSEIHWRCRAVVAADGMHSAVARSLAIRSSSSWPRRLGMIAHYDHIEGMDGVGEMHVGRGAYCGLAPLPGGRVNVGLVVPLGLSSARPRSTDARFTEGLRCIPDLPHRFHRARRLTPLRGMGPMSRVVERVAGPGFLLAGDAAGFLDPFTGEGIYRALRGAELAASCIASELSKTPGRRLPDLSGYAVLRRREFGPKERFTWLVQLALTYPPVLSTLCTHISNSPLLREPIGNILGDLISPSALLRPRLLAGLLLPLSGSQG